MRVQILQIKINHILLMDLRVLKLRRLEAIILCLPIPKGKYL